MEATAAKSDRPSCGTIVVLEVFLEAAELVERPSTVCRARWSIEGGLKRAPTTAEMPSGFSCCALTRSSSTFCLGQGQSGGMWSVPVRKVSHLAMSAGVEKTAPAGAPQCQLVVFVCGRGTATCGSCGSTPSTMLAASEAVCSHGPDHYSYPEVS